MKFKARINADTEISVPAVQAFTRMLVEAGWSEKSAAELQANEFCVVEAGNTYIVNIGPWTFNGNRVTFSFRKTGEFLGLSVDNGDVKPIDMSILDSRMVGRPYAGPDADW